MIGLLIIETVASNQGPGHCWLLKLWQGSKVLDTSGSFCDLASYSGSTKNQTSCFWEVYEGKCLRYQQEELKRVWYFVLFQFSHAHIWFSFCKQVTFILQRGHVFILPLWGWLLFWVSSKDRLAKLLQRQLNCFLAGITNYSQYNISHSWWTGPR